MGSNPKAPPVYKPNTHKAVAPPVYRPQVQPAQMKQSNNLKLENRPMPLVYRPQQASVPTTQTKASLFPSALQCQGMYQKLGFSTPGNPKVALPGKIAAPAPRLANGREGTGQNGPSVLQSKVTQRALGSGIRPAPLVYRSQLAAPVKQTSHSPAAGQLVATTIQRALGFAELKEPAGYGSVILSATLNGVDLGKAWSKGSPYSDTEHAEDHVLDLIEAAEMAAAMGLGDESSRKVAALLKAKNVLIINNLTATPCSSKRGTCKKGDMTGCAERLIRLAEQKEPCTYKITINADHYYQPAVDDAKNKSRLACDDMIAAGITVSVAKP